MKKVILPSLILSITFLICALILMFADTMTKSIGG